jgi:peptide/nickel transport system substrate-binding protein
MTPRILASPTRRGRREAPGEGASRLLRPATLLLTAVVLISCAAPGPTGPASNPGGGEAPRATTAPKKIVAAIGENILAANREVARARAVGSPSGALELERLVNGGMVVVDAAGVAQPELAEAVPSIENGRWRVLPDGRMETHYSIKPGARWHDGTPFTSADLVFTNDLWQDREFGVFRNVQLDAVERIDAPDARSIVVHWRQPFIYADTMFTPLLASPLPKHKLESVYAHGKAAFLDAPYWMNEHVGTGAFRIADWVGGSHISLHANPDYVLGRPKLDEIEVRIVEDDNTLWANILSGTIDIAPLERGLSIENAVMARDQWRDGRVLVAPAGWTIVFPQFINPNPAIVTNLQFRRALLHGIDRQQLVDTLMHGFGGVAHSYVGEMDPDYPQVASSIVRYDYDPRRAGSLIEGLGYSKGQDGFYRDAAGQRLGIDHRTTTSPENEKITFAVSDQWQRLGVSVETTVIPPQRARDGEYVAGFPAFRTISQGRVLERLRLRHSSATPLPSNNYVGQNYSRYMNPEFDAMIDRYYTTIPPQERLEVVRQILFHVSDQLPLMGLLYDADQLFVNHRLQNVTHTRLLGNTQTWNAHQWELR